MAIIKKPEDVIIGTTGVTCAICGDQRPLLEVTAGLHDLNGRQAFACNEHFWDGGTLYIGWTAFITRQRWLALETDMVNAEGSDAWPLR
jgi:hypothetical protein